MSRIDDPKAYMAEGVLFLTPSARFDYLLQRPEGSNVGRAVNEAMADIEKHNPRLGGVLPRNYQIFNGTLLKELLKKVAATPDPKPPPDARPAAAATAFRAGVFPDYTQEDAAEGIIGFEFAASESIFTLDLTARIAAAASRQGYFQRHFEANHPLRQAFDFLLLGNHCGGYALYLVVHPDDRGNRVPHLVGNTHQAAFRSMRAMRLFDASTNASASSIAALARALDLFIWLIIPSSALSSSEGRNDAAARRKYSPIERPAALDILAIRPFSAAVRRTGIRSEAAIASLLYGHVQHMHIIGRNNCGFKTALSTPPRGECRTAGDGPQTT
jgi:HsdM-like protein